MKLNSNTLISAAAGIAVSVAAQWAFQVLKQKRLLPGVI